MPAELTAGRIWVRVSADARCPNNASGQWGQRKRGCLMMKRVVKMLPLAIAAIGGVILFLGFGFIVFGRGLQPTGAISLDLDGYRYVAAASLRLSRLANDAGISLLVVGMALLLLARLAVYWRRVTKPLPT